MEVKTEVYCKFTRTYNGPSTKEVSQSLSVCLMIFLSYDLRVFKLGLYLRGSSNKKFVMYLSFPSHVTHITYMSMASL